MDLSRKTAFQILLEIEKENSFSNLIINKFINENNPDDTSFVRELAYGVLENKMLLDYYLNCLIPSGIERVKIREKVLLRLGLYQLMFMNSVPEYAALNETVNIAKKVCKGREGFINGVLRGYLKKKKQISLPSDDYKEYLSIKYSFPLWIINMWEAQYGSDILESLLKASNMRAELCIRINLTKISLEEMESRLDTLGFKTRRGKFSNRVLYVRGKSLIDTKEYNDGLFSVQDEASVMACEILKPKPQDTVIDTCAAPGGKTSAIAEMMNNQGTIISCDVYDHTLKLIREQAKRLGIDIVSTRLIDGIKGDDSFKEKADCVLVDAPCSGLGVIRKKPEIKYKSSEDIKELICIQRQILFKSSEYVKIGGTLLYSTCTINKNENDRQIENFLESHREYEIIEKRQFLPTDDVDGFFICKMMKKGN